MKGYLYCFFLLVTTVVFSQEKTTLTDKQYIELQEKTRMLINSNIDSAFILVNKIENSKNYLHKTFAIGTKSYLFQIKGDSIKSKQYYKLAFKLLKKIPSSDEKTRVHAYLLNYGGSIDLKNNDFSDALDKFQEGKRLSEKVDDLIQVVKFNNNIALINSEVGNYKLAIKASKESDKFTDKIEFLYTKAQFIRNKSNVNFYLGSFYEDYYKTDRSKKYALDSAEYYYKKALNYSKNHIYNRVNAKINLGNIYYLKGDLLRAKDIYQEVLFITKDDVNLQKEYYKAVYNLGDLNFFLKKYDEALVDFQKVDSIYAVTQTGRQQFINSNYYQAKIHNFFEEGDKAIHYSKIYIDNFEKNESKINDEAFKVNLKLNHSIVKNEMLDIQDKYKNQILFRNCFIGLIIFLIVFLFFIKHKMDKKKIDKKINAIIETYKLNQKDQEGLSSNLESEEKSLIIEVNKQSKKESVSINLDEEKENEIINKLSILEEKLFYLNSDFTQQAVAKKIKTNTTYLSYVVNKKFNKTFSEYSNELKINYAINEMISNPTYRKYSTQAIAESVGFKNAISFTKSFSKRTGVTPVQFVKRLETNKI